MRRNNVVFMVGEVIAYTRREMEINESLTPVMDILLLTDSIDISGQHRIMVRGQQTVELTYLFAAVTDRPVEVMIIGWLYSDHDTSIVIAERVTAVLDSRTRKVAASAMSKHRQEDQSYKT